MRLPTRAEVLQALSLGYLAFNIYTGYEGYQFGRKEAEVRKYLASIGRELPPPSAKELGYYALMDQFERHAASMCQRWEKNGVASCQERNKKEITPTRRGLILAEVGTRLVLITVGSLGTVGGAKIGYVETMMAPTMEPN